jgi:hypothetical protein
MSDYMSDFSLKCGSWTGSFYYLCKAITGYLLLPLAFIALLTGLGPRLEEIVGAGIDFGPIVTEFAMYLDRYMVYSIPLIVFAIFIGYYPAGNYARIPFKFIASVYLAVMLLMFTDGGHLSVSLGGESLSSMGIDGLDMTLDIVGIIYILSIIAFVKGFLAFTEFSDNRKQYLENLAEKFNMKDEKAANKARKGSELDFDEEDEPVEAAPVQAEEPEAAPAKEEPAEAAPAEERPEEVPEEAAPAAETEEAPAEEPTEAPAEEKSESTAEDAEKKE